MRAIADIDADILMRRQALRDLRTERRITMVRLAGVKPRSFCTHYRRWTAEEETAISLDWHSTMPLGEIEQKHRITRGQLAGLRARRGWKERRRPLLPEMTPKQRRTYIKIRAHGVSRDETLATVLA